MTERPDPICTHPVESADPLPVEDGPPVLRWPPERERNEALIQWMDEYKVTARELVDALNSFIRELTGRQGLVAERTVLKWRAGLYAPLTHARTAVHHGDLRDHKAVRRSIDHAHDALGRADLQAPRPPWTRFYDQAELELLALIAHSAPGSWTDAEAHAHRTLPLLRPDLVRNRSLALAHMARAQLEQGVPEAAVASAREIPRAAWHGRTGLLLQSFAIRLTTLAPNHPDARAWADYTREKGTT